MSIQRQRSVGVAILFTLLCLLRASSVNAQTLSPAPVFSPTQGPLVEFIPAGTKGTSKGATILNLTFFRVRPTALASRAALQSWLQAAVTVDGRRHSVLATAWFSPTGKPIDEEMIELGEASGQKSYSLIFRPAANKIELFVLGHIKELDDVR